RHDDPPAFTERRDCAGAALRTAYLDLGCGVDGLGTQVAVPKLAGCGHESTVACGSRTKGCPQNDPAPVDHLARRPAPIDALPRLRWERLDPGNLGRRASRPAAALRYGPDLNGDRHG